MTDSLEVPTVPVEEPVIELDEEVSEYELEYEPPADPTIEGTEGEPE